MHSHMRVVHADGEKSAKIPLHRGLRQGGPLSPIFGGVVVNAVLQWQEFKGGGLSQGDVVTNTLCFADDSTLMTTNVYNINVLLESILDLPFGFPINNIISKCSFSLCQQLLPMGGCED